MPCPSSIPLACRISRPIDPPCRPPTSAVQSVVYISRRKSAMATAEAKIHMSEFTNEPFVDFSQPENKKAMEEALKKVASEFGSEYPMYIAGQKIFTTEKMKSTNPSHPTQVLGIFQTATAEHANLAVEAANKAFESWKRIPAE